jgi:hypothetical protein
VYEYEYEYEYEYVQADLAVPGVMLEELGVAPPVDRRVGNRSSISKPTTVASAPRLSQIEKGRIGRPDSALLWRLALTACCANGFEIEADQSTGCTPRSVSRRSKASMRCVSSSKSSWSTPPACACEQDDVVAV